MTQLQPILKQFHDDLDRASELLKLTLLFREFAGSEVPGEILLGTVSWEESTALAEIAPQVRTDLPIMSGSILLYLCGRFENFVRETVMAIGDEYATRAADYNGLPKVIRDELFSRTLEVAKSPKKYSFEATEIEQILGTLVDSLRGENVDTVQIDSRLLAITDANMHSRMTAEVFKRVGITDFWRDVGRQAPLKRFLGESDDAQCTREASSRLDAIMQERNGIAHPTSATTFPGPDKVQETVSYLKVLSQIIIDLALVPRSV